MPNTKTIIVFVAGVAFAYFLLPRITPFVYAALGKGGE